MSDLVWRGDVVEQQALDYTHELADSVKFAVLPNEKSGTSILDVKKGQTFEMEGLNWRGDGSVSGQDTIAHNLDDIAPNPDNDDIIFLFDIDLGNLSIGGGGFNGTVFQLDGTSNGDKLSLGVTYHYGGSYGVNFHRQVNYASDSIYYNIKNQRAVALLHYSSTGVAKYYVNGELVHTTSSGTMGFVLSKFLFNAKLYMSASYGTPSYLYMASYLKSPTAFTDAQVQALADDPYQLFQTAEDKQEEYCLVFDDISQQLNIPFSGAFTGNYVTDDGSEVPISGTGAYQLTGQSNLKITKLIATDSGGNKVYNFNRTTGTTVLDLYGSANDATLVNFPDDDSQWQRLVEKQVFTVGTGMDYTALNEAVEDQRDQDYHSVFKLIEDHTVYTKAYTNSGNYFVNGYTIEGSGNGFVGDFNDGQVTRLTVDGGIGGYFIYDQTQRLTFRNLLIDSSGSDLIYYLGNGGYKMYSCGVVATGSSPIRIRAGKNYHFKDSGFLRKDVGECFYLESIQDVPYVDNCMILGEYNNNTYSLIRNRYTQPVYTNCIGYNKGTSDVFKHLFDELEIQGSNNVSNKPNAEAKGIGVQDVNLPTYFVDPDNDDYRINETGQTALQGQGWNGSDIASWAYSQDTGVQYVTSDLTLLYEMSGKLTVDLALKTSVNTNVVTNLNTKYNINSIVVNDLHNLLDIKNNVVTSLSTLTSLLENVSSDLSIVYEVGVNEIGVLVVTLGIKTDLNENVEKSLDVVNTYNENLIKDLVLKQEMLNAVNNYIGISTPTQENIYTNASVVLELLTNLEANHTVKTALYENIRTDLYVTGSINSNVNTTITSITEMNTNVYTALGIKYGIDLGNIKVIPSNTYTVNVYDPRKVTSKTQTNFKINKGRR